MNPGTVTKLFSTNDNFSLLIHESPTPNGLNESSEDQNHKWTAIIVLMNYPIIY